MRSRPKAHEGQWAAAVEPYIDELFVRYPLCHGDTRLKQDDQGGQHHSGREMSGLMCFWRIGWRVKANQQRGPHQGGLSNHWFQFPLRPIAGYGIGGEALARPRMPAIGLEQMGEGLQEQIATPTQNYAICAWNSGLAARLTGHPERLNTVIDMI